MLHCQLSLIEDGLPFVPRRLSNVNRKLCFYYFWSTYVDSINVFDCRLSDVGFVMCSMIQRWTFYLVLLVLERKIYNNDDITLFSVY